MRPTSSRARSLRDRKSRARSGAGGRPASWTRSLGRRALRRSACRFPPTSCRRGGWMVPIHIAVVSLDGQYMSFGGLTAIGKWPSALIATLVTVLLFGWLGKLRRRDPRAGSGSTGSGGTGSGGTGSGGTGSGRHLAQPLLEYFLGMDRRPFHRTRQGPEPLPFPDLLLDGDHCLGARLCVCRHGQPLEHDPEHDVAARDRRHRLRHSAVDLVGHVRGLDVAAARRKHRDRGRPRRREAEAAGVLAAP